jgi:hypothetical protein
VAKTYAVRPSVRVRGVTYRNPTEAFVAADELEHDAEERAGQARRNGDEAFADSIVDRGRADAEKLRTWARQREEFEAAETSQPANVPRSPAPRRSAPSPKGPGRAPRPSRSRSRAFGGRSGSLARRGYLRSGAQAQARSAGLLGWQIAGATIGVALLTLFLTRRGTQAFAELTSAAATALRVIVDPVDPLRPHLLDDYVAQAQAATMPAVPLPRVPVTRRSSSRGVLV